MKNTKQTTIKMAKENPRGRYNDVDRRPDPETRIHTGEPFRFFATVDCVYQFEPNDRVMLNFSSTAWKNRRKPVSSNTPLILDSGGFSELEKNGEYSFSIGHYLEKVDEVIRPDVFATMDWMCEPSRLEATGLSVDEHIDRTVDNAAEILNRYNGKAEPMAVVQGWEVEDYLSCIDRMKDRGVLTDYLGVGSICRRDKEEEVKPIVQAVAENTPDRVKLHAFGLKKTCLGYEEIIRNLYSADSFAWSKANIHTYDIRGKDRRHYTAAWARDAELTAYKALLRDCEADMGTHTDKNQTTLGKL